MSKNVVICLGERNKERKRRRRTAKKTADTHFRGKKGEAPCCLLENYADRKKEIPASPTSDMIFPGVKEKKERESVPVLRLRTGEERH